MRTVIVIPTYDEAATIGRLLTAVAVLRARAGLEEPMAGVEVLVVDDGSPDGTQDVVRAHPGHGVWVHLLARTGKDGLGAAYRAGFAEALARGYDAVVQMDADGSHPASALPALLALLADHDLAIGSRYVAGGACEDWPLRRRALSRGANVYARTLLGLRTRDTTAGFRAWRADALRAAGVLATTSHGYAFQIENTWRAEAAGLRVAEHPITFTDRTAGSSKMSGDVAREAALQVWRWRLQGRAGLALPDRHEPAVRS